MVNDNQRREVANQLRDARPSTYYDEELVDLMKDALLPAYPVETWREPTDVLSALADLIDPTCHVVSTISYDWSDGTEYAHKLSCGHTCYTDCPEPSAYCCKCGRRVVEKEDE